MILFWGLVWDATNCKGTTLFQTSTLVVGKIWVAGKRDRGVGAQEVGPPGAEYKSGGTKGSHPGMDIFPDLPPGVRPISHSHGGLREPGGGAPPGGSTDQVVPGVATLEWIFLRTCLQWARALLWGKVQLTGALSCHRLRNLLMWGRQFPHSKMSGGMTLEWKSGSLLLK